MSNHARKRNSWVRKGSAVAGTVAGTAAVGGLLFTAHPHAQASGHFLPASLSMRASNPGGQGYWLVSASGQVYAFGGAVNYGGMSPKTLDGPIVGIVASPDGAGYWLVAQDGGVFGFGDAHFFGSLGKPGSSSPIVGAAGLPAAGAGGVGPAGPTGPPGPRGSNGAKGATGATGATGGRGAAGPTGATGTTGAKGAPGNSGAVGNTGPAGPAVAEFGGWVKVATNQGQLTATCTLIYSYGPSPFTITAAGIPNSQGPADCHIASGGFAAGYVPTATGWTSAPGLGVLSDWQISNAAPGSFDVTLPGIPQGGSFSNSYGFYFLVTIPPPTATTSTIPPAVKPTGHSS